jgi:hypothetical protein
MGRAFGELEQSFYDSGGVLSQRTCTDDARHPHFRPRVERSRPHLAISGRFTETVPLGVPDCVELGGYYAFAVADGPDELVEYASYEVDAG